MLYFVVIRVCGFTFVQGFEVAMGGCEGCLRTVVGRAWRSSVVWCCHSELVWKVTILTA